MRKTLHEIREWLKAALLAAILFEIGEPVELRPLRLSPSSPAASVANTATATGVTVNIYNTVESCRQPCCHGGPKAHER